MAESLRTFLGRSKPLQKVGFAFGLSGLVAGLIWFGLFLYHCEGNLRWKQAMTEPGRLLQLEVVTTSDGQELFLVHGSVETRMWGRSADRRTAHRLDLLDPQTGRRIKRLVVNVGGPVPSLSSATKGLFWNYYSEVEQLELRDVSTLSVAVSWSQLQDRVPALAEGLAQHIQPRVDRGTGTVVFTTVNAESWSLDPLTFACRPFRETRDVVRPDSRHGGGEVLVSTLSVPEFRARLGDLRLIEVQDQPVIGAVTPEQSAVLRLVPRLVPLGGSDCRTTTSADVPARGTYSFTSVDQGPRRTLAFSADWRSEEVQPDSDTTFIDPSIVAHCDNGTTEGIRFPDDQGLLVTHLARLGTDRPSLRFSRVTFDGRAAWTVEDRPGTLMDGYLTGDIVVVAVAGVGNDPSYLLAVYWRTGQLAWRYEV